MYPGTALALGSAAARNRLLIRGAQMAAAGLRRRRQRYGPYMTLGRFAMNNRAAIMRGVAGLRSRAKRGRKRRKIQHRSYPSNSRGQYHTQFIPGNAGYRQYLAKDLYTDVLDLPQQSLGSTDRLTGSIYIKGLKMCMQIFNTQEYPIQVHMALIQFSRKENAENQGLIKTQFFRADNGERTSIDFQEFSDNSGWDMRYICNPINPDNKRVIHHRKITLGGRRNDLALKQTDYYRIMDKYFPIKRKVYFNTSNDAINEKPWVWCMWALPIDSDQHNTSTQQQLFKFNYKKKWYYHNIV